MNAPTAELESCDMFCMFLQQKISVWESGGNAWANGIALNRMLSMLS